MLKNKIKALVLMVVALSIIVSMIGCTTTKAPSPTQSTVTMFDRIAALESQINSVSTKEAGLETDFRTMKDQVAKFPAGSELSSALLKATDAQSNASNAQSIANNALSTAQKAASKDDVQTLQTQINNLQTTNKDVVARVTKLETTPTPTPTPTKTATSSTNLNTLGNVSLKVTSYSGMIIPQDTFDFAGNTYSVANIEITNNGNGYTSPPSVTVKNGLGSTIAHAIMSGASPNLSLAGIEIDSSEGYLSYRDPPIVLISLPQTSGGVPATAIINSSDMVLTQMTTDALITLKITNNESYDINNLIFDIFISSDTDLTNKVTTKLKLNGSNASFKSTYSDSSEFDFETSGNGLLIQAGKTKYVYITPVIQLKSIIDQDVSFSVTAKIVDYSS